MLLLCLLVKNVSDALWGVVQSVAYLRMGGCDDGDIKAFGNCTLWYLCRYKVVDMCVPTCCCLSMAGCAGMHSVAAVVGQAFERCRS